MCCFLRCVSCPILLLRVQQHLHWPCLPCASLHACIARCIPPLSHAPPRPGDRAPRSPPPSRLPVPVPVRGALKTPSIAYIACGAPHHPLHRRGRCQDAPEGGLQLGQPQVRVGGGRVRRRPLLGHHRGTCGVVCVGHRAPALGARHLWLVAAWGRASGSSPSAAAAAGRRRLRLSLSDPAAPKTTQQASPMTHPALRAFPGIACLRDSARPRTQALWPAPPACGAQTACSPNTACTGCQAGPCIALGFRI